MVISHMGHGYFLYVTWLFLICDMVISHIGHGYFFFFKFLFPQELSCDMIFQVIVDLYPNFRIHSM